MLGDVSLQLSECCLSSFQEVHRSVLSVGIPADIICFRAAIRYLLHPHDAFNLQPQLWNQRFNRPELLLLMERAAAAAASSLERSGNGTAAGFMVITV